MKARARSTSNKCCYLFGKFLAQIRSTLVITKMGKQITRASWRGRKVPLRHKCRMFPPRRKDRKVPEFQSCAPEAPLGTENLPSFFSNSLKQNELKLGEKVQVSVQESKEHDPARTNRTWQQCLASIQKWHVIFVKIMACVHYQLNFECQSKEATETSGSSGQT